jgi:hypothetical protein
MSHLLHRARRLEQDGGGIRQLVNIQQDRLQPHVRLWLCSIPGGFVQRCCQRQRDIWWLPCARLALDPGPPEHLKKADRSARQTAGQTGELNTATANLVHSDVQSGADAWGLKNLDNAQVVWVYIVRNASLQLCPPTSESYGRKKGRR